MTEGKVYRCIGCDCIVPWNGVGLFSFTCPCEATIFYNEETGQTAMPASVAIGISKGQSLPHLDCLVGGSDHTSPIKERLIAELREKGFIWMEECKQCQKDGTLKRKQEREAYRAVIEAERIIRTKGGEQSGCG